MATNPSPKGHTDRIDFEQFYPFLAWMHASSHLMLRLKPLHPALMARIVNDPNPNVPAIQLPDGWEGRVVVLNDMQLPSPAAPPGSMAWFPHAQSPKVARKLCRRMIYSDYLLPILTAISTAIFVEMYSTSSGLDASRPDGRRVRLRYRSMPIADFGIAMGSVRVASQDRLTYMKLSDDSFTRGPDPDNHYWLYFTTVKGEEIILECGMFPFNMCQVVNTIPYLPPQMPTEPSADVRVGWAPCHVVERTMRKNTPSLHTERKRLSMLRHPKLQEAVKSFQAIFRDVSDDVPLPGPSDFKPFFDYMEELSGRSLEIVEKNMFAQFSRINCFSMHYVLCGEEWKKFPLEPQLGIEEDPDEADYLHDERALSKKRKEQKRRHRSSTSKKRR